MSNKLILSLFALVMVSLIGGIVYMTLHPRPLKQSQTSQLQQAQTSQTNPSTLTKEKSPSVAAQGTSDNQLQQDSTAIDDSFNALDTELTNVDNSLNDQPTNLQ